MYICIYVNMYMCIRICVYVYMFWCAYVHICVYVNVCVCVSAYAYGYANVYVYVFAYVHVGVYIYIYIRDKIYPEGLCKGRHGLWNTRRKCHNYNYNIDVLTNMMSLHNSSHSYLTTTIKNAPAEIRFPSIKFIISILFELICCSPQQCTLGFHTSVLGSHFVAEPVLPQKQCFPQHFSLPSCGAFFVQAFPHMPSWHQTHK